MSIFGIGPLLVLAGGAGFGFGKFAEAYFGVSFRLHGLALAGASLLAALLLLAGLYFWIGAVIQLRLGHGKNELLTGGVYARCRNPMYAAFILFLAPALALLLNNLYYLCAPALMYAAFDSLIEREEKFLLEKFGPAYEAYAGRTPQLLPKLFS
ncbi:MAG TPA: methyltransferase [Elusimicrobiales bacterium]|nr:methyltransferase [Elusimicrobiales bacterium]